MYVFPHLPNAHSGELAPLHEYAGCRVSSGPFPPPLLIRKELFSYITVSITTLRIFVNKIKIIFQHHSLE
ncbi:MAG: hypothetical protein PWP07_61 [Epulopiscium sp.]|nr:hypothetical protein [Candidatus Epulonipiscium sp.]